MHPVVWHLRFIKRNGPSDTVVAQLVKMIIKILHNRQVPFIKIRIFEILIDRIKKIQEFSSIYSNLPQLWIVVADFHDYSGGK